MTWQPPADATRRTVRRAIVFRLAAIALGLAPLAAAELVLAALGWGRPEDSQDPFVGFSSVRPLFVANEQDGCYAIPPARQLFFRPENFALHKGPHEFRIFCLGGSTVQGRPLATETAFTTWLQFSLAAAEPDRDWEVVNCGGISYASYRLAPILDEVLQYQPDLLVLCTGHNEFLEDRTYSHIKYRPRLLSESQQWASRWRTYAVARESWLWLQGRSTRQLLQQRPTLGQEADAMLEYRDGLRQYHRDETWRRQVVEHYAYNLRRMLQSARRAGVPVLLVNPVSNLRDCPPFKSQHRAGLTKLQADQFDRWLAAGRRLLESDPRRALPLIQQAVELDDQYAEAWFLLGQCRDRLRADSQALEAYRRAQELDICPLRMLDSMRDALWRIAAEFRTPVVDVQAEFERRCPEGIVGEYLMLDHVHPSIRGHQIIANLLTDAMIQIGRVVPQDGWKRIRDQHYRRYLMSLENLYFVEGEKRLETLRHWTAGRATREKGDTAGQGQFGPK